MHRTLAILAGLLAATGASAQDSRAVYHTPQGEVVVNAGQPAPRDFGPPPPFAQLGHGNPIGPEAADVYPPLANDFIRADRNRDGRISRAEYERWVSRH